MAATRTKIPIGSAPWLVQERRQADELIGMETEEFGYAVRNEMEWLNEHMGEIFSSSNLNVADIFKTPGKLRGKTPRTARKRNVLGERAPLTDIFAPNTQASASPAKNHFYNKVAQIQIQQDENHDENRPSAVPSPAKAAPLRSKHNWDSGYHGITDDEVDIEQLQSQASTSTKEAIDEEPIPEELEALAPVTVEVRRTTNETFVSAREDANSRRESTIPDERPTTAESADDQDAPAVEVILAMQQTAEDDQEEMEADDPSDASSPGKPLMRKSSFTFSSLPTREPLAQKKSMGARSSVLNNARSSFVGRFTGGKSIGGQQSALHVDDDEDAMEVDEPARPLLAREASETTRVHNHTTTEELRNRINMLGQSRDIRTSKSIPNLNASTNKPLYPQVGHQAQLDKSEGENNRPTTAPAVAVKKLMPGALEEDDEDDWIAPIAPATQQETSRPAISRTQTTESVELLQAEPYVAQASPRRMPSPSRELFGHKKAASSSALSSPTRSAMGAYAAHQKAISVSNPIDEATTPIGSPRRGHLDGAVSATKSKLYSAFRSAKNIFASSAGVSAQAKMNTLSPGPKSKQQNAEDGYFAGAEIPYPNLPQSRIASAETAVSTDTAASRKTRSSTEREYKRKEQEAKQMSKMEQEFERIREKERQKATAAAAQKLQRSPSKDTFATARSGAPSRAESEHSKVAEDADSADEMPPPPPPKSMLPTGQGQRLREPRRIVKPNKAAPAPAKPAPVTIRMHVPSQLGHRTAAGPSTNALSQSLQDSLGPPTVPPKPAMVSKNSTASLHSSQSQGTLRGGNPSAAAKKALDAAAKKKEADAKAAQRKAERQREIEQRRQAKQEDERRRQEEERRKQEEEKRRVDEERRADQRRRQAEMQRREDTKRQQIERQAAEQRRMQLEEQERTERQRLEQQQRMEQQRREQQRAQQEGFAYALKQEKAQAAASNHPRSELGAARPMSRMMHHENRPPVQVNPAKPKRALAEDDDQPQRPGVNRNPASYQQQEAKRRKTIDEDDEQPDQRRSVMAGPPVRQSNINKQNKFPHGYNVAPQPGQHGGSMFIKAVTGQHQMMHGKQTDMAKFGTGRIPFADAPNPPGANPSKTPLRQSPRQQALKSAHKSSPAYPNPESINLPEIATDSEDEDSENEFQAPSWTESPALRQLLTSQQLLDPMAVFGPIAPLRMEEVFRNKERQKKFRDRTSSAQWHADKLTEEERERDQEAREKMMRDGGWSFGAGNAPAQ